jgi:hypothetical protein
MGSQEPTLELDPMSHLRCEFLIKIPWERALWPNIFKRDFIRSHCHLSEPLAQDSLEEFCGLFVLCFLALFGGSPCWFGLGVLVPYIPVNTWEPE